MKCVELVFSLTFKLSFSKEEATHKVRSVFKVFNSIA